MAHRFLYKPSGTTLTCHLYEAWSIGVDGDAVIVKLTSPFNNILLYERYYAYSGYVKLYDIGSLIENDLRSIGHQQGDYTLSLLSDSGTVDESCIIHALYCDRFSVCTDVDYFLTENFLTTLSVRRVAPGSTLSLFYLKNSQETGTVNIAYRWRVSGSPDNLLAGSYDILSNTPDAEGVQRVNISLSSIIYEISRSLLLLSSSIELVSFTVSVGQRSVTFFIDKSLKNDQWFSFKNCFNVWDMAFLPHSTTAKTEVERSTAIINHNSLFYNQQTTKTYEVESGPLTSDEAEWIDQLFTSYEVFRVAPNECDETEPYIVKTILITDSTCEMSDGDEKPNSVKFTWRYADNRPIVNFSASQGIFTSEYNSVFS